MPTGSLTPKSFEPSDDAGFGTAGVRERTNRVDQSPDRARPPHQLCRYKHESGVWLIVLRSPRCFDQDKVGDVLCHDAPMLQLSRDEDLLIGEPAERGDLLHRGGVDVSTAESVGNGRRKHLVEQESHL